MEKSYKEKLIQFFKTQDQFAAHNEIEVVDVQEGWAKVQVDLKEHHMNGAGMAHGGIIFTLADLALGLAVHSHGRMAVTLSAEISYFNPAKLGSVITAETEELVLRNSIASYIISIKDEEGLLMATMKCQAFRKGELKL